VSSRHGWQRSQGSPADVADADPVRSVDIDVEAERRSVRRLAMIALAAVLIAVAAAAALAWPRGPRHVDGARLLPVQFTQRGFVETPVRRAAAFGFPRDTTVATPKLPLRVGQVSYVIARCDSGQVTISVGALSSAQRCTGRAVGVVTLRPTESRLPVRVRVSRPQRGDWAIGVYR